MRMLASVLNSRMQTSTRAFCAVFCVVAMLGRWTPAAHADLSGPWPPALGAYFWSGGDASGNGGVDDWANSWYGGRYQIEGDGVNPPVLTWLPAQDGDALLFRDNFIVPDGPYSVGGGGVSLPNSNVTFSIYANVGGASFDVKNISIATDSDDAHPGSFPVNFNGTTLGANQSFVATNDNTLTFSGATIDSPVIQFDAGSTPPASGASGSSPGISLISIKNGSKVKGGVIMVGPSGAASGGSNVDVSASSLSGFGIQVGFGQQQSPVQLNLKDGSDAVFTQFVIVGMQGQANMILSGDSTMLSPDAYCVIGQDGIGLLRISDTSKVEFKAMQIGLRQTGDLAIDTGGTLDSDDTTIGCVGGITGTANVESGGEWHANGDLVVGGPGLGYMYVRQDGVVKVTNSEKKLKIGDTNGGAGLVSLSKNGALDVAGDAVIGGNGAGTLAMTDASYFVATGEVKVGESAGSNGLFQVDASASAETLDDFTIGDQGTGQLTITGGGTVHSQGASLGEESTAIGKAQITGASSTWTVGDLTIGSKGSGEVDLENSGTLSVSGAELSIGEEMGGGGTLTISAGGNLQFTGELKVGGKGIGTLGLQAAAHYTASAITAGEDASGLGHINVDGGSSLQVLHDLTAGDNGAATVSVTNGSTLGTDAEATLGEQLGSSVTANVESGSQWQALNLTVGSRGIVYFNVLSAGQVHALGDVTLAEMAGSVVTANVDGTNSKMVVESLNVGGSDAIPGGTATLNVTNHGHVFVGGRTSTWTGSTIHLDGGGVTIGDAATPAADGFVRINEEGVLAGSGTIEGNVLNAAGEVSPGSEAATGKLVIHGDFTQGADGAIHIRLGGAGAADYDQLVVNGAGVLAGTLDVTTMNSFVLSTGNSFSILQFTSMSGSFGALNLPALAAGLSWDTTQFYAHGVLAVTGTAIAIPGDFNHDGVVDAADYVVWRSGFGTTYTQGDYNAWRTHFGQTAGSGSGGIRSVAIPEPTTLVLMIFAAASSCLRRRRIA